MIGYTTLGTVDLQRARTFYDAVLAPLGATLLLANEREAYWGHGPDAVKFASVVPFDGQPSSVGNGTMIALRAESPEQVDSTHRAALGHGGTDDGAPGSRGQGGFYGAYFRDPDGHKICVFTKARGD